jgi:hypothetical protein
MPYGPDDPAYGPPDPSRYQRQPDAAPGPGRPAALEESARGPFEPLRREDGVQTPVLGAPSFDPRGFAPPSFDPPGFDAPSSGSPGTVYRDEVATAATAATTTIAVNGENGEGALGRIKDLYQTADAIGDDNLDNRFERLLERQRQLISDYFKESDRDSPGERSAR